MEQSDLNHFVIRAMESSGGYRFAVDGYPEDDGPSTVRKAFTKQRELLQKQLEEMDAVLASDKPEKAEGIMSTNPDFKIWTVVVTAPLNADQFSANFDRIAESLLKKPDPQRNNKEA